MTLFMLAKLRLCAVLLFIGSTHRINKPKRFHLTPNVRVNSFLVVCWTIGVRAYACNSAILIERLESYGYDEAFPK